MRMRLLNFALRCGVVSTNAMEANIWQTMVLHCGA